MNNFRKICRTMIIAVLLSCVALLAAACGNEDSGPKLSFTKALSDTDAAVKKISTAADMSLVMYDGNGNPMRITERLTLERMSDGESIYLNGNLQTSTYSLSEALEAFVSIAGVMMGNDDLEGYLKNEKAIKFEAALSGETLNGRVDLCGKEETPDYIYSFRDNSDETSEEIVMIDKNMFFGVGLADVERFMEEMDQDVLDGLDIKEALMTPFRLPADWSNLKNKHSDTFNAGSSSYNYGFTVASSSLWDLVQSTIKSMIDENIEKGVFDENSLPVKLYDNYLDKIKSWIKISDANVTASASENGLLKNLSSTLSVSLSVPDSDLIQIAEELELLEDSAQLKNMLTMVHNYVSAENGVKGLTEVKFLFNVSEDFAYEAELDKTNDIFSSEVAELPARTFMKYELNAETGKYGWNAYGGDFAADFAEAKRKSGERTKD